jgi:hypothetical protein
MTELMTMDSMGRIHREDDARIIIEILEANQLVNVFKMTSII